MLSVPGLLTIGGIYIQPDEMVALNITQSWPGLVLSPDSFDNKQQCVIRWWISDCLNQSKFIALTVGIVRGPIKTVFFVTHSVR